MDAAGYVLSALGNTSFPIYRAQMFTLFSDIIYYFHYSKNVTFYRCAES